MERRSVRSGEAGHPSARAQTVVDARMSLALWLRAGRAQRGMSLEDVARVTKIQLRILERLESGKPDGLPADVFVRGFVRSIAKCVGLDEAEALRRYAACGAADAPVARAVVDAMADLAPDTARIAATVVARKQHDTAPPSVSAATTAAIEAAMPSSVDVASRVEADESSSRGEISSPAIAAAAVAEPVAIAAAAVEQIAPSAAAAVEQISVAPSAHADEQAIVATLVEAQKSDAPSANAGGGSSKKRRRKARGTGPQATGKRGKRKELATGTPASASPVVASSSANAIATSDAAQANAASDVAQANATSNVAQANAASDAAASAEEPAPMIEPILDPLVVPPHDPALEPIATATWKPTMPPLPAPTPTVTAAPATVTAATTPVPWRRPSYVIPRSAKAVARPSLVIDDADPESAERELEERASANAPRRSFLPPILLDREDRSARQGGLTLAVIILLIAATLTLSYLMRRPSSSGDGVTSRDVPTAPIA